MRAGTVGVAVEGSRHGEKAGRWRALTLLCAAQFVLVLNFQIGAVALPLVGRGLGLSADGLHWVISANALAFGGGLLPAGRAADLVGHRRLFVAGLAVFAGASLACGLAPAGGVLIAARAAQGLGTALFTPASLALLADTFPEGAQRNRALGIWGASGPIGGIVSLLLGGAMVGAFGWRWAYFLGVPLAVVAAALAPRVLVERGKHDRGARPDVAGALLGTAGVVALVYALGGLARAGGGTLRMAGVLGVGMALLAAFVAVQRRVAAPLVPRGLLRPGLVGAVSVAFLHGAATNTPIFFFALYMQDVRGSTPFVTGLAFLPCNVAIVGGSALGSRLADRVGHARTMAAGMGAMIVGLPILARIPVEGSWLAPVVVGFAFEGAGLGLALVGIVGAATAAARDGERGIAAGLVNTSAQVGTAVGLALLVALATARTASVAGDAAAGAAATVEGFRWAFLGAAGLAVVGLGVAIVVGRGGGSDGVRGRGRVGVVD